MNQMLKKASSVCTALFCAASLTFSGTSMVMAADKMDDTTKTQIESYAENLTQSIISLTEDQISAYAESGDDFTENAMTAWTAVKDEVGEMKEIGTAEVEYSDNEYTAVVPVEFADKDVEFTYVVDDTLTPASVAIDIQYSFGTTMKNAALNTLMGIGTVFVILVMLIFLISLFKFIPGSGAYQAKAKKSSEPVPAVAPVPVVAPTAGETTDDKELIAVIAAAIAAAEGTSTDGFVVRSIRKINRKKR